MARLRIAPAAQQDICDVRAYSKAAFGPRVARDYVEGLRQAFSLLRERPLAGASEEDLGSSIRGFSYRSHRIYYRLDPRSILIVRILHHAQDHGEALEGAR